jgi:hypothetical protein
MADFQPYQDSPINKQLESLQTKAFIIPFQYENQN